MTEYKRYRREESAIFLKTSERFGGLSNMAAGYPLTINGVKILTSEALYQACRFPHNSEIQKRIIGQKSPMTAKMVSKPFRSESRQDWDNVRVRIMYWCLRVKLIQHWEKFGELLLSTGNMPIVEESHRDQFWGAKSLDPETLEGVNMLGQLLTKLREELKRPEAYRLRTVEPPVEREGFYLIDKPIGTIGVCQSGTQQTLTVSSQEVIAEQLIAHTLTYSSTALQQDAEKREAPLLGTIAPSTAIQAEFSW